MRWVIWSLAVIFYLYEYILRVVPSIIVSDLMQAFSATAGQLGLLSAFYMFAYAPMQVPVGILMDRYGARKLLTFAAALCACGSIFFGFSPFLTMASIGRFMMGIGSAFAFVGVVYICSHWFEADKLALLVGIANSLGMLGAFCGQGPLSYGVELVGWRQASYILGYFGLTLALVLYFAIRKEPAGMSSTHDRKNEKAATVIEKIKQVTTNFQTWVNSFIALTFYSITVAFAGLWAVPFLTNCYGLSTSAAGFASSMIFLGWIVGGPLIGHYSDRIEKRKPLLFIFATLCLVAMLMVIYLVNLPAWALYVLLFVVGFCQSAELLCYCLAIELNSKAVKGTAVAITNFMVFLAGAIIQPLVGYLLDLNWDGTMQNGERLYSLTDYQMAMLVFPATLLLALIFTLFLKEKREHEHPEVQY